METIITNPGLQHLAEKVFWNLNVESLKYCAGINHFCKQISQHHAPDPPDEDGKTPIHQIAAAPCTGRKYLDILNILLAHTENPNMPDNEGWTPIHAAAIKGNTNIVKVLMKYTETPNAEDDAGRTPLKLAKRLGHDELINILQNFTI